MFTTFLDSHRTMKNLIGLVDTGVIFRQDIT